MERNQDLTVAYVTAKVNGGANVLRNIFHFNSEAIEDAFRNEFNDTARLTDFVAVSAAQIGASIAYFLSPRTIEDYYDHDYTKYEQSIALMVSNLLCLMVITYYNVPVFVAILVYVGIYSLTRKALTHDLLQHASHTS